MKEYIIIMILTWLFKSLIDLGIKYSQTTENTIDDFIFSKLKELINILSNIKTRKK